MLQNITTVSQILNKYLLAARKNILQVLSSSPVRFHSATPWGSLFFSFQAVYHLRFCHSRATILPFFCCRESFCCLEQSIFPKQLSVLECSLLTWWLVFSQSCSSPTCLDVWGTGKECESKCIMVSGGWARPEEEESCF